MSRLAAEAAAVVERVIQDPSVLADVARKFRSRLTTDRHQRRLSQGAAAVELPVPGLARVLDLDPELIRACVQTPGFRRVLADLHTYEMPVSARHIGGGAFLEVCYAIARLARPTTVLETGVAHGFSTAAILQALEDNGHGRLYSVDLPMFRPGSVVHTGDAIPARLRGRRWELHLGSDRRVLPGLLRRIGPIDFLFYDSDTAYEAMWHTWTLVWPRLAPGAVMAMNIVHANDAYLEFAEAQGLRPVIVPQPKRQGAYPRERSRGERISYLGLLRKPADR
jgi:predicted O-methyltransferase YrrM